MADFHSLYDSFILSVKLNDIEIIEKYYNLSKDCLQLQDSCFWSSVGKSRTCSRRLIDTDENVLFTLTRQNQCDDVYDITIKYNRVIFETSMKAKTRVKLTPRAADDQLMIKGTLGRWYLFLNVDTEDRISRAKLFLDLSQSTLSGHGFLMEGVFHNDPNCHPSGTPVKLIVGITMGLFILAVIVLTGFLVRRNIKNSPKPNVLIEEDELDTAV